mmetsp:Transcript_265/g.578  ORF Transcript_265/g.578 Transcript_265/m.578 type:complete len:264 (-) Transcript_265:16-807(-)
MHGKRPTKGKSSSLTAVRQKSATSARVMEPASPSTMLMMPLGASRVRPPGRTTVNSRSLPGPLEKSASWLFLSAKMERMTVFIKILNTNGACFSLSPAPIEVTTAIRFTPYFFIALITQVVPSVHMVGPTSLVLPPSAIMTPVTSWPSKTLSTSSCLVTSPTTTLAPSRGFPASAPPEPWGMTSLALLRTSVVTDPFLSPWKTASLPTPPLPPNTAMDMRGRMLRAAAFAQRSARATPILATTVMVSARISSFLFIWLSNVVY